MNRCPRSDGKDRMSPWDLVFVPLGQPFPSRTTLGSQVRAKAEGIVDRLRLLRRQPVMKSTILLLGWANPSLSTESRKKFEKIQKVSESLAFSSLWCQKRPIIYEGRKIATENGSLLWKKSLFEKTERLQRVKIGKSVLVVLRTSRRYLY